MSELEDEIERLRSRNADLTEILEAVERESGWVPKDTPMPEFIRQLRKERDELKWDIEAYRGALGYSVSGSHTGKLTDGSTPQCGMCNSEYRKNLESERDAALKCCAELREAIETLWPHCDMKAFGGSKPRWLIHALSTSCGKDYVSWDEVKPLVEACMIALGMMRETAHNDSPSHWNAIEKVKIALAHWRKEEK